MFMFSLHFVAESVTCFHKRLCERFQAICSLKFFQKRVENVREKLYKSYTFWAISGPIQVVCKVPWIVVKRHWKRSTLFHLISKSAYVQETLTSQIRKIQRSLLFFNDSLPPLKQFHWD